MTKYPKGVSSHSPGLVAKATYPGFTFHWITTLKGLRTQHSGSTEPFQGTWASDSQPRVGRHGDQPWAMGQNPFGVQMLDF